MPEETQSYPEDSVEAQAASETPESEGDETVDEDSE